MGALLRQYYVNKQREWIIFFDREINREQETRHKQRDDGRKRKRPEKQRLVIKRRS